MSGCLLIPIAVLALSAGAKAQDNPPKPPKIVALSVTPSTTGAQAFRYRLLPLDSERTAGEAVPIYLRLLAEQSEKAREELRRKPHDWLELPIAEFPVDEAARFVAQFSFRLETLDFAARRKTCDWAYPVAEQRDKAYQILLPDAQGLRDWARLNAVRARAAVATGRYDDAARSIETGLAMARHLAEAPFLINGLVGVATADKTLDAATGWAGRPGSANLYWSLTALPRPLISIRAGSETEQALFGWVVPEFAEAERGVGPDAWPSLLARLHARLVAVQAEMTDNKPAPVAGALANLKAGFVLANFKATVLPEARKAMAGRPGPIDDDRAIVLHLVETFRTLRDEVFRGTYLPYPEALAFYEEAKRNTAALGSFAPLLASVVPSVRQTHLTMTYLDRKVATLRVIEAIRLHAGANGGALPATLAAITVVPVPDDPVTGKPFDYRREGDAALLPPPPDLPGTGEVPTYRITIRP